MPEGRYPTEQEFWRRLEVRGLEPDLREALRERLDRQSRRVERAGAHDVVVAVAGRLVPGAVPAEALAAFLDEAFDRQLGRGDEREGVLPRERLVPAGFAAIDREARRVHRRGFAELGPDDRDALLRAAERGELSAGGGFDSAEWFKRVVELLLLGYGSDPRGMVDMGYPGPPYRPGHIWLDEREVDARVRRRPGYLEL